MRVAIWGAGTLGQGIAFKLMTSVYTTELVWINRNYDKINAHSIDFKHGLAFAPTCRRIYCAREIHASEVLPDAQILVLCHGTGVRPGQKRSDIYQANSEVFDKTIIQYIRENGFEGIILVLTNHVDLMSRYLHRETALDHHRIIGLGTVVETARMRRALSESLGGNWRAHQLWPFAIGTHDENFVPVFPKSVIGPGCWFDDQKHERIKSQIIQEVIRSAERVKLAGMNRNASGSQFVAGTMFPIVEGAFRVISSIALDKREVLTVSVYDESSGYYYSMPSIIGSRGVIQVQKDFLNAMPELKDPLEKSIEKLSEVVQMK